MHELAYWSERRQMGRATSETSYLFVYGTLRAAAATEWSRLLAAKSRLVGAGRTRGALFDLGGYPGMTAGSDEDAWVNGDVCLLHDPASDWVLLDAYEGCGPDDRLPHEFERQVVRVVLEDGRVVDAWAYFYCPNTQGRCRIAGGEWTLPLRSLQRTAPDDKEPGY
jgi:gamma-glutamylcyclotransferase (GGCT)/AIG2-like uncharacterized protein YtfP